MKIERFDCTGRMSRVVKYGDMLFLSGVTAGQAGESVEEQTKAVLARIEELLVQHILSTTIYLKDISDFAGMNSVWDPWVAKGNEPARACVEAALAAPSIKVEMSVTAAVKD